MLLVIVTPLCEDREKKLHCMHLVDKTVIIINNEKTSWTHWRYNSKKDWQVLMCWHPFDFFGVSLKKNLLNKRRVSDWSILETAIKKTLRNFGRHSMNTKSRKLSQGSWSGYYQRKYLCSKNNLFQDSNNLLPINSLFLICASWIW